MTPEELKAILRSDATSIQQMSGGDINTVLHVKTGTKQFIIKQNEADRYPEMLIKEKKGLELLRESNTFRIPEVYLANVEDGRQFLVMEYISEGIPSASFEILFANKLAKLHLCSHASFGWETDNYIGSLTQSNTYQSTWVDFLISERFIPQIRLGQDTGSISASERKLMEEFMRHAEDFWPIEKPSLLHGDLWAGNYLKDESGKPVLIDPAVYYGHREMDIGMMHLFGGFAPKIFEYYQEFFPLEKGWKERIEYNQLYPLLVHLNLFGRSYWPQIREIVNRF